MLLIKNGRVIDPAGKKERNADIVVKDGKIEKIYPEGTLPSEAEAAADQVLDAKGLVVAPGLVDVHVHFRDPGLTYKEDIHTGAAAAAKAGDCRQRSGSLSRFEYRYPERADDPACECEPHRGGVHGAEGRGSGRGLLRCALSPPRCRLLYSSDL